MVQETDYYKILGLIASAESAVIKAAYRALVGIYHPDKIGDEKEAEKIKKINAAYAILSDPIKKADYDKKRDSVQNNACAAAFESDSTFPSHETTDGGNICENCATVKNKRQDALHRKLSLYMHYEKCIRDMT